MVLPQDGGVWVEDGGHCGTVRFSRGPVPVGACLDSISLILSCAQIIEVYFVVIGNGGLLVNAADVFAGQRIDRQLDLTAHV